MIDKLSQNARLAIACVLSTIIIFMWDKFILENIREEQRIVEADKPQHSILEQKPAELSSREEIIAQGTKSRANFENEFIKGSINLRGARLDDLVLKKYRPDAGLSNQNVILLSPSHTKDSYFTEFGWVKTEVNNNVNLPNNKTLWEVDSNKIKAGEVLTLQWTNAEGIRFLIKMTLDEKYMFNIRQEVENNSASNLSISPYALISRMQNDINTDNMVVHQGAVGVVNGKLKEITYSDLISEKKHTFKDKTDWLGFTDKYWLVAIIPQGERYDHATFSSALLHNHKYFQGSVVGEITTLKAGERSAASAHFFAGAKELEQLDAYENKLNIKLFDRAVDFGILYFITRPLLELLHYFYGFLGNFGIAILLLTVVIKLLLFPLAHKGYKGMNRLKDLQPKMAQLKEKFADNPSGFQQALLELYRKEKVNPMAGCLPIILQIPVFFALYKVLYVSIEMRHAAFFGWIKDLSAPDPTSIFNLFGLIPWDPPSVLMVGFYPLLMAITMYLQQKLNPEPADPAQAIVIKLMPWVLLFMFASFPSGLVIYWAWSNVLSIFQQLLIRQLEGEKKKGNIVKHKKASQ